jgi:NADPH-dependent glutamate synthase beta subunit-like oxidoreductase
VAAPDGSIPGFERVAIVGAGPAGYFAARRLVTPRTGGSSEVKVDFYEVLPTPFGLARSGIAPDHQEAKRVQYSKGNFTDTAQHPQVDYLGNVEVGKHITLAEIRRHYNAVLLTYGASQDKTLGWEDHPFPGETLDGVHQAKSFVNWYNGHPDYADLAPDLSCETAIILGVGNVALDLARILAKTPEELDDKECDICPHARDALAKSKIKHIIVVGRRGHIQASFTRPELKELTQLQGAALVIEESEIEMGRNDESLALAKEKTRDGKQAKKMDKFFGDLVKKGASGGGDDKRTLSVRFLLGQQEIIAHDADSTKAGAVRFRRHRLVGQGIEAVEEGADDSEVTIPAGLVITSIGQKSTALACEKGAEWFDQSTNRITNEAGRVPVDLAGPGLYCAGWVKTGPKGVIGDSRDCAAESAARLLADAKAGLLPAIEEGCDGGIDKIAADLASVEGCEPVRWKGWRNIEHAEEVNGLLNGGKIREKIVSVEQMVSIANDPEASQLIHGQKHVWSESPPPNLPYMVVSIELQSSLQAELDARGIPWEALLPALARAESRETLKAIKGRPDVFLDMVQADPMGFVQNPTTVLAAVQALANAAKQKKE